MRSKQLYRERRFEPAVIPTASHLFAARHLAGLPWEPNDLVPLESYAKGLGLDPNGDHDDRLEMLSWLRWGLQSFESEDGEIMVSRSGATLWSITMAAFVISLGGDPDPKHLGREFEALAWLYGRLKKSGELLRTMV